MGCSGSVEHHPVVSTPVVEGPRKDTNPTDKISVSSGAKAEVVRAIATHPSNPVEKEKSVLPGAVPPKPDEEQDLYVPPLSPRKLKEIEKWLESLPSPDTIPEEDVPIVAVNSGTSILPPASEGAAAPTSGRQEPTEHPPTEKHPSRSSMGLSQSSPSAANPSPLTMEHLNNHVKILSAKDRQPHAIGQGLNHYASGIAEIGSELNRVDSTMAAANRSSGNVLSPTKNAHAAPFPTDTKSTRSGEGIRLPPLAERPPRTDPNPPQHVEHT